jgi:hypothetical protein
MRFVLITVLLFITSISLAQWNPDAGLVIPLNSGAIITVSSGTGSDLMVDGDLNTYWESTSPLPENYISRKELNIFLLDSRFNVDEQNKYLTNAFDGLTSTKSVISSGYCELQFKKPEHISLLSVKINTIDTVSIVLKTTKGILNYSFLPVENYSLKSIIIPDTSDLISISFSSRVQFELFEIAGLYTLPFEEITLDLKSEKTVGQLTSRHYNGDGVLSINVFASSNNSDWIKIAGLNAKATPFISQLISPEIKTRYIRIRFFLKPRPYQKAKLHEIEIYDKYGTFGMPNDAKPSINTYSKSFGINAIWGWGYNLPSNKLDLNKGPDCFSKVARLARNYHSLDWDIKKPTNNPGYFNMKNGKGTSATLWLNWESEYGSWKRAGFTIDACIMFNNQYFPDNLWKDTEDEAFNFGGYFAEFFGDTDMLVSCVEVGNEPWDYSKEKYRKILSGMSKGIRNKSELMTILPCATQAYNKSLDNGNYISQYLDQQNVKNISGLNTHVYSYIFDNDGSRVAINPEDPRSEVWSVNNMKVFSTSNLDNLPIYVTEYGYDSEGGGDDCSHSVCISEFDQAIYGIRMTLILYRLGVKQFYWYYYANVDYKSILHNRSGITSSYSKGFEKKKSYYAFELMQKEIGDYYFHSVVMENDQGYVYAFADINNNIRKIIAWRPTSENHNEKEWIEFPCNDVMEDAILILSEPGKSDKPSIVKTVNSIRVSLSGVPVIITIDSK